MPPPAPVPVSDRCSEWVRVVCGQLSKSRNSFNSINSERIRRRRIKISLSGHFRRSMAKILKRTTAPYASPHDRMQHKGSHSGLHSENIDIDMGRDGSTGSLDSELRGSQKIAIVDVAMDAGDGKTAAPGEVLGEPLSTSGEESQEEVAACR